MSERMESIRRMAKAADDAGLYDEVILPDDYEPTPPPTTAPTTPETRVEVLRRAWKDTQCFQVYGEGSKQVPEMTISDECRWCAEGEPEWSSDAKCWIHRRATVDKRCTRKRLSPTGEPAESAAGPATDAERHAFVGALIAENAELRERIAQLEYEYDAQHADAARVGLLADGMRIERDAALDEVERLKGLVTEIRDICFVEYDLKSGQVRQVEELCERALATKETK